MTTAVRLCLASWRVRCKVPSDSIATQSVTSTLHTKSSSHLPSPPGAVLRNTQCRHSDKVRVVGVGATGFATLVAALCTVAVEQLPKLSSMVCSVCFSFCFFWRSQVRHTIPLCHSLNTPVTSRSPALRAVRVLIAVLCACICVVCVVCVVCVRQRMKQRNVRTYCIVCTIGLCWRRGCTRPCWGGHRLLLEALVKTKTGPHSVVPVWAIEGDKGLGFPLRTVAGAIVALLPPLTNKKGPVFLPFSRFLREELFHLNMYPLKNNEI